MTLLNLNIEKAAGPGRRALPLEVAVIREVEESDLALLGAVDAGSVPQPLQRITDRHRSLARLLAGGMKPGEAALILGLSNSRVSVIQNSPAFQELMAFYRSEVQGEFTTTYEHMAGLSRDALLELRDRLEENPKDFSTRELLTVVTELVDRSGGAEESVNMPTKIELVAPDLPLPSESDADSTDTTGS